MSFELIMRISLKLFGMLKFFSSKTEIFYFYIIFYSGLGFVALKYGFLVWIGN